jgi:polar amino acid transport system substrate-binding protein
MLKAVFIFILSVHLISQPLLAEEESTLTIVRGQGDYSPFEMLNADNQLTGVHIDIVRAVAKLTDTRIKFKSLPWSRALHWLEVGKADAITYIGKTLEREEFAIFDNRNVLSTSHNAFFTLKTNLPECNTYTGDLKQFIGNKIGVLNGYSYGDAFDNADYLTKDDGANTEDILFQKLIKGRFLIGIANINTITYIAKKEDFTDKIVFLEPHMPGIKQYIAFSKTPDNAVIADKFGAALTAFKTTAHYREILAKYGL